jgi:hypothetical protein
MFPPVVCLHPEPAESPCCFPVAEVMALISNFDVVTMDMLCCSRQVAPSAYDSEVAVCLSDCKMRPVVCKEPLRALRGAVLLAACMAMGRDVARGASRAKWRGGRCLPAGGCYDIEDAAADRWTESRRSCGT